ncbi:MAG TPA: STAS domain-containing protein [Acidimicrobiales bacterium]|nr:STAS domain-containing protein [Acidimicrobiales bacterium]
MSTSGAPEAAGRPAVNPGELQVVVSGAEPEYQMQLVGELDMSTAPQFREQLLRLVSDGATLVTVDLSELAFVDSTGLSVLITGLKRLRQQGGEMALRSPTPGTRRVLEITGLTEVFSIS